MALLEVLFRKPREGQEFFSVFLDAPEKMRSSFSFFFFSFFCLFRATPTAYGGFQARGLIVAVAASLHHSHSHSNAGPEPRMRPTPQLMATPDPQPTERGQGWNLQPHGS